MVPVPPHSPSPPPPALPLPFNQVAAQHAALPPLRPPPRIDIQAAMNAVRE
jgi:hypothetical protein